MRLFKKFPRCACLHTRLTVHSLMMTAVPVLALAIGEDLALRRWSHCQGAAREYAIAERLYRDQAREIAAEFGSQQRFRLALERRAWIADRAAELRRTRENGAARAWDCEPHPPDGRVPNKTIGRSMERLINS
jgi:hypothetical protein